MIIETTKVGYLDTNCYVLKKEDKCLIIDPGDDWEKIKEKISETTVLAVLITHSHFDHVGALKNITEIYKVPIISYKNIEQNFFKIGPFSFEIISTPGHSKDSISFYFKKEQSMFVGDFIFKGSIGRCDLEGGNLDEMYNSINQLKKYHDLMLYPGHGDFTTLYFEKLNNPYFN